MRSINNWTSLLTDTCSNHHIILLFTILCENRRFDGEFPRLPDIQQVLDAEMRCDSSAGEDATAATGTQQNDSDGPTPPFHRLDASLFYASPPAPGSSDDAELSVTAQSAPDAGGRSSSPVLTLTDITDGVDVDLLRTVFLLSDFLAA